MGLAYLHFNIFGLALSDMAKSTGSISERLAGAYMNSFIKVQWDRDIEAIPTQYREDFLKLKKILFDDVTSVILKEKALIQQDYARLNIVVSEEHLGERSNARTVIKSMHWRKAKRAAELISEIFFDLGRAVAEESKNRRK